MKIKIVIALLVFSSVFAEGLNEKFKVAGKNKGELKKALQNSPANQRSGMEWLIRHMPDEDLKTVSARFLLENCMLAYQARERSSWGSEIPESIFFEYVLPFANLNEKRESWRRDFFNRYSKVMRASQRPSHATARLNNMIYDELGVKYSTKRPKADQAPYESMDIGLASCTGLSILLIDACRSIGVPARFVGTPMWYNNSGNHSWVEIWDDGWHYTGAAEPTGLELNKVWFSDLASRAVEGHPDYGIYAATWARSDLYFPMNWLPDVKTYNAVDVTDRYAIGSKDELVPIRIRALDAKGNRRAVAVFVTGEDNFSVEGLTKSEVHDANDHLTLMLVRGKSFMIKTEHDHKNIVVTKEEIIDLKLLDTY